MNPAGTQAGFIPTTERNAMATKITNQEWAKLIENEDFDTADLLCAVDAVDEMRDYLNDGAGGHPPSTKSNAF
jgi:hypothetical protein